MRPARRGSPRFSARMATLSWEGILNLGPSRLGMLLLRCSSSAKSVNELLRLGGRFEGMLFISPKAVRSRKELEAAFALASAAFREKTNISPKLSNEALLFLACETNFASAARKAGTSSTDDFAIVSQEKIPIATLRKKLLLAKAETINLGEWGKKKGAYFEAELAIERMALSRIKN